MSFELSGIVFGADEPVGESRQAELALAMALDMAASTAAAAGRGAAIHGGTRAQHQVGLTLSVGESGQQIVTISGLERVKRNKVWELVAQSDGSMHFVGREKTFEEVAAQGGSKLEVKEG